MRSSLSWLPYLLLHRKNESCQGWTRVAFLTAGHQFIHTLCSVPSAPWEEVLSYSRLLLAPLYSTFSKDFPHHWLHHSLVSLASSVFFIQCQHIRVPSNSFSLLFKHKMVQPGYTSKLSSYPSFITRLFPSCRLTLLVSFCPLSYLWILMSTKSTVCSRHRWPLNCQMWWAFFSTW